MMYYDELSNNCKITHLWHSFNRNRFLLMQHKTQNVSVEMTFFILFVKLSLCERLSLT